MKRIAILTSGGDAPGMNPCIRAIVYKAEETGVEILAVRRGFKGLIDNEFVPMQVKDTSGIIQRGGTILHTARCEEFKYEEAQKEALKNLVNHRCEGLIIIGGDGSLRGAAAIADRGVNIIGIPCSIDNDIYGTDMALGVDTALNNIVEVIDKIKDTASSHERTFIIEVMGRNSGYLALISAIATGAEAVIIPEVEYDLEGIAGRILERYKRHKTANIIVVAEGASTGYQIGRKLEKIANIISKITVLGHLQRGGSPTSFDRLLGSRLGSAAVKELLNGNSSCMVGILKGDVKATSLEEVLHNKKGFDENLINLAKTLGK
jgi:6-phosphofructokinase 1